MGLPYVLSSDLVSAYPAKSLEIAQYVDGLIPLLAMTQNAQTGVTYSFVLTDFTKLVTLSNASSVAVTLPLESSVAWPTGTQLRLLNLGAGTVTVAGAVGVTINGSPLTLAQFKAATLIKNGTNTWTFLPFSSGVGAANFSDAATGTYTGFKYKTFSSGSGTLTVTTAGFADIVVCGGGGGGGNDPGENTVNGGGGGAGGTVVLTNFYLPVGTHTVVVGGGGAAGSNTGGSDSGLGTLCTAVGGGTGTQFGSNAYPRKGGSGGGGAGTATTNARTAAGPVLSQGFSGGDGHTVAGAGAGGGGGGGASAVGGTGTASVGGVGGAGTTSTIAGTTPTGAYSAGSYAFGGGGGGARTSGSAGAGGAGGGGKGQDGTAAVAGAANTGGGGGGAYQTGTAAAGGSGVVIVRVAV